MNDFSNPYGPPQEHDSFERGHCPVCAEYVGYARFILPFGYCQNCRNYLAIRSWTGTTWPWSVAIYGALFIPIFVKLIWKIRFDFPTIEILLAWLIIRFIYDRFFGRLVPAVCWGFGAFQDDDRLELPTMTFDEWIDRDR